MATETYTGRLVVQECYKCNINFGVPPYKHRMCAEDGESFFCPNGHSQGFSTSEITKLKREKARLESRLDQMAASRDEARSQRDTAEHRRRAEKAAKTRLKNRIKNGVCPECNRHFINVERHMKSKHSDAVDAK